MSEESLFKLGMILSIISVPIGADTLTNMLCTNTEYQCIGYTPIKVPQWVSSGFLFIGATGLILMFTSNPKENIP